MYQFPPFCDIWAAICTEREHETGGEMLALLLIALAPVPKMPQDPAINAAKVEIESFLNVPWGVTHEYLSSDLHPRLLEFANNDFASGTALWILKISGAVLFDLQGYSIKDFYRMHSAERYWILWSIETNCEKPIRKK